MEKRKQSAYSMRVLHRYIGFFLAGIMAVYALSGIVLIFRDTDFLKQTSHREKMLRANMTAEEVGKEIKKRDLKFTRTEGTISYFENGTYNISSGKAEYDVKELPKVIGSLTKLHKANTGSPLFILNIFFGVSLLFFVLSAFWMFRPNSRIFKKGIWFAVAGIVLVLVMIYV